MPEITIGHPASQSFDAELGEFGNLSYPLTIKVTSFFPRKISLAELGVNVTLDGGIAADGSSTEVKIREFSLLARFCSSMQTMSLGYGYAKSVVIKTANDKPKKSGKKANPESPQEAKSEKEQTLKEPSAGNATEVKQNEADAESGLEDQLDKVEA